MWANARLNKRALKKTKDCCLCSHVSSSRSAQLLSLSAYVDANNKVDPREVVIRCGFGAPSLIYNMQYEIAHNHKS